MNPQSAEVWENKEIATGIFRLKLRPYGPVLHVDPGRFFMLGLGGGHDPLLRRPLSHLGVSAVEEGILVTEFLYEVRGRGTELMSRLQPPRIINFIGPLGQGWRLDPRPERVIMVAGGLGVVPLFAAAKILALQKPRPEIIFIYGARQSRGLVLGDELKKMTAELRLFTEDGSKGKKGLATEGLLEVTKKKSSRSALVLACGPRPMLKAVARIAPEKNLSCQVSLEARMACGLGACLTCVIKGADGKNRRVCQEGPVFMASEVDWEALDDCA